MHDALSGVSILEVGTMTPGKYAGYLMCGWGARAIRIERPGEAGQLSTEDLLLNRGKRSLTLNLRAPEGRDVLLKLAARADVLMESYRPGVAARLGIDYGAVRAVNPALVYCSLSGFGQDGPDAMRPAYDLLFQAETGFSQLFAAPGAPPAPPRTYLADAVSGLMSAFAVSSALRRREATGEGTHIDLSMQESLFSLLSVSHGTIGEDGRSAAAESETWAKRPAYDIYRCGDGRHVAITAARPNSCRALFEHLGRPELAELGMEPGAAGAEASDFIATCLTRRPAEAWVEELSALDIEVAPVNAPAEAMELAQLKGRGMVRESEHPQAGRLLQIGVPGVGAGAEPMPPAPAVGADNEAILGELGYDADAVAELRAAGTI